MCVTVLCVFIMNIESSKNNAGFYQNAARGMNNSNSLALPDKSINQPYDRYVARVW